VALLVAAAFLLAAASASASWGWEGVVGAGGNGNGQCPLYSGQSACSPYDYWDRINAANSIYTGGTTLAGFETSSVIRGVYMHQGDERIVYASALYLGGSLIKGHQTWCSWNFFECYNAWTYAYVWFRVYP
jgi:hypothetical protein